MREVSIDKAIRQWVTLLGAERVITDVASVDIYMQATMEGVHMVRAILKPQNAQQVKDIIAIAARSRVAIYPISTGHNWGYGDRSPITDHCVLLDLHELRNISFDAVHGIVTVEPGVTQAMLHEYLETHTLPYMVPVTGGGPDCSILGNALERGYGITPFVDHWGAVMKLKAVLADGSEYENFLAEVGAHSVSHLHKWGIGPHIDGLFCQGAFGIVTEISIRLKKRPKHFLQFIFTLKDDIALESAMSDIQEMMQSLEGIIGGVNFMNDRRVLAMTEPCMHTLSTPGKIIDPERILFFRSQKHILRWSGIGALYGDAEVVRAAKIVVKKYLGTHTHQLVFVTPQKLNMLEKTISAFSWIPFCARLRPFVHSLRESGNVFLGIPSRVALPLAYLRNKTADPKISSADPAHDGSGLIWFTPLVPIHGKTVLQYIRLVEHVCTKYGIEPLITCTTISTVTFDSSVPIVFDHTSVADTRNAHACHDELLKECLKMGLYPYRLGLQSMHAVTSTSSVFWSVVSRLKKTLDPYNIIAPGRYTPTPQPKEKNKTL